MLKHRLGRVESLVDGLDQLMRRRRSLPARKLQTAQDVIDLLQEQVEAIRHESLADPLEKARAVGYLAGQARRAIETSTLAERLQVLEQVLKHRERGDQ